MKGRKTRAAVGLVAAMMLALPAIALGSKTFFTASDGKSSIFMALKNSGGKEKLVDFSWDGLQCGSDRFTAGLDDPIKVKSDGSFKSQQPVSGTSPGVDIDATLKGRVSKDIAKITGKLKLTGDCEGHAEFTATESAG